MNNSSKETLYFKMIDYGEVLYSRNEVSSIYERMSAKIDFETYTMVVVDFTGVKSVSSGFAFDLFNKLKLSMGDSFLAKIRIKFDESPSVDLMRSVVRGAVNSQIKQK